METASIQLLILTIIGHQLPQLAAYRCMLTENDGVEAFVMNAEEQLMKSMQKASFAAWEYECNINDENLQAALDAEMEDDLLTKTLGKEALKYDINKIENEDLKRKMRLIRDIGVAALDSDKLAKFNELTAEMSQLFDTGKVLDYETRTIRYSLEPELTEIFAHSRDPDELKYYWEEWRKNTGQKMKRMYSDYLHYYNEAAELNGHWDASLMWVNDYESENFIQEMADTWEGLKPLYQELHAYVRYKLNKMYGDDVVSKDGAIPAHLLGNMWAQTWNNLAEDLNPFEEGASMDITAEMIKQNWTPQRMFREADEFFQSLGLEACPKEFWTGSILVKPDDGRELVCHASAWDFFNGKDFRIKQCTRVNVEELVTAFHEMGHIQYYLLYKNQSYLFREGANPGFHEAVGDVIALSVETPSFFKEIGLLSKQFEETYSADINLLLGKALTSVAFLPWGYLVDKFRWDLFSGAASKTNMNCHWWKLRHEIQGIKPPSKRNNNQFDPGAKYHIAGDVGYVRYFTASIYKYQFYKALCLESGDYVPGDPSKPLHRCNFYSSKKAGKKLKEMLSLGASRPWMEVMEKMTGYPGMSTDAIREYYAPLEDWLRLENQKNGVEVGWGDLNLKDVCTY